MTDLTVCPHCDRDMVYPVDWDEAGPKYWEVELRCGNCGWEVVGQWDQATMDAFDDALDRQTAALTLALVRVERENLTVEADRFAAALHVDAILPEDF